MRDIRKMLKIEIKSPFWDEAFKKALEEPLVPVWLTEEYICNIQNEYNLFSQNYELILTAVAEIVKVPELCILAKILYYIIDKNKPFSQAFTACELPKAPKNTENPLGYECVGAFPIIAHLSESIKLLEQRGIEREIISKSLRTIDCMFTYSYEITGRKCFEKQFFKSYTEALSTNNLVLGRLRFEIRKNYIIPARVFKSKSGEYCVLLCDTVIHKSGNILGSFGNTDEDGSYDADFVESDSSYVGYSVDKITRLAQNVRTTLSKDEWTCIYKPGDDVIKVHIPHGPGLKKELCQDSYKKARAIFQKHYSDINLNCFMLTCWMLSPELKNILPETSNIICFQDDYLVFPAKSNACDAFQYVFGIITDDASSVNINDLSENNSLQKGAKQKLLEGKYIHQFNGFIEL